MKILWKGEEMHTRKLHLHLMRNRLDEKGWECPVFIQISGEEGRRLVKRIELHEATAGYEGLVIVPESREEMRSRNKADKDSQ